MQVQISATIADDLKIFIEQLSIELKKSKSAVIEQSIRLLQQKKLNEKMKAGCLADNQESLEFAQSGQKITDIWDE